MNWIFTDKFKNSLQPLVSKYSFVTVLVTTLITIFFLIQLPRLQFENSPDKFSLPQNDPVKIERNRFEQIFEPGEIILVGQKYNGQIHFDDIKRLNQITDSLNALEGIKKVINISNISKFSWVKRIGFSTLVTSPYFNPAKTYHPDTLNNLVDELAQSSIYKNILITNDKNNIIHLISIEKSITKDSKKLDRLLSDIKQIFISSGVYDKDLYFAGTPVLNIALQQTMKSDLLKFGPVSILVCIILLIVFFRNWAAVISAIFTAIIALIWTVGLLPLTNTPITLNLSMIVPVVLALAVVYATHHLACIFKSETVNSNNTNVCFQKVINPALLCALTTAIGFSALITSSFSGIRETGIFMGAGVIITSALANLFMPAFINLFKLYPTKISTRENHFVRILNSLSNVTVSKPTLLIGIIISVSILAIYGISKLNIETNHLSYLSNRQNISEAFRYIDNKFGGVLPLEILVEMPNEQANQAVMDIINFEGRLKNESAAHIALSAADLILSMEQAKPEIKASYRPLLYLDRNVIDKKIWSITAGDSGYGSFLYRDSNKTIFRISCRIPAVGSNQLREYVNQVKYLTDQYLNDYKVSVTGLSVYFAKVEDYVITTQINSFGLALIVIMLLLGMLSGSLRLGIIVILVNLIPVFVILGIMGWLNIPLDISTVMIASITLGIVADDTIHIIYRFRELQRKQLDKNTSLLQAVTRVGLPVVITTLVLSFSFLSLIFGTMTPTIYFGVLSASTILFACLADLILLPALIKRFII